MTAGFIDEKLRAQADVDLRAKLDFFVSVASNVGNEFQRRGNVFSLEIGVIQRDFFPLVGED